MMLQDDQKFETGNSGVESCSCDRSGIGQRRPRPGLVKWQTSSLSSLVKDGPIYLQFALINKFLAEHLKCIA